MHAGTHGVRRLVRGFGSTVAVAGLGLLFGAGLPGQNVLADVIPPPYPGGVLNGRLYMPLGNAPGQETATVADTAIHVQSGTVNTGYILMDGINTTMQMRFRRGQGTATALTKLVSGANIGRVTFAGHDGTDWSGAQASMHVHTPADWSTTSHPTYLSFSTTPIGSITQADIMRLQNDGSTTIGGATLDPAGTNKLYVLGNVNITTGSVYKVNNVQVLGARNTGWTAPTGTPTKTGFATSTVTTAVLAEHVKAVIDALTTHGILGP